MNLLARREHSEQELLRKLRAKKFPEHELHNVVQQLVAEGLLSNSRFLENYIHHRSQKGFGPLRIRAELLERGVAENLIEQNLNIHDNAWFVHARSVWQKKFRAVLPSDFKQRAQQMRFLLQRGFTQEQITAVLQLKNYELHAE